MSQSTAAKRYALALFQLAEQHNQLTDVEQDLREIKIVFKENQELQVFLDSPKLSLERKKDFIRELFGKANPFVVNILQLLIDRNRIKETVAVVTEFEVLSNEAQGITDAKVFSTRPLSDEEREAISSAFAQKVGKKSLRIENIIDPALLGGIRLQIGNRIFDSSVSAKLDRLKKQLIG